MRSQSVQKEARSSAVAKSRLPSSEGDTVKRKRGRPPRKSVSTGVSDPYEMSDYVIGFKLENHRMDSLNRLAEIYCEAEGRKYSAAQVARKLVCHMIRELERKIDSGEISLKDPNRKLPG